MMRGAGARAPLLPYDGGGGRGGGRSRGRSCYSLRQLLAFIAGGALCCAAVVAMQRRAAAQDAEEAARAAAEAAAFDADGAYVNRARAGGGFRDGYKPDTLAADARAPDKPGDSSAVRRGSRPCGVARASDARARAQTILRRLVAAVTLQERAVRPLPPRQRARFKRGAHHSPGRSCAPLSQVQEISMLSSLVKSLAMGGEGAFPRRLRASVALRRALRAAQGMSRGRLSASLRRAPYR